jgi:8-oxo-dGTP pyrophosphatase MutT (NUDIX family)
MAKGPVRAAGGIVWRLRSDDALEGKQRQVLVVHRPHYDDWSFPKGKHEVDETDLDCALREVEEETGLLVTAGAELPTVEYLDHKNRDKTVAYWAMTVLPACDDEAFVINDEVDEMRWLAPPDARSLLTYPIDQLLLDEFTSMEELGAVATSFSSIAES